jgi:hypothetical protein
MKKTILLLAFLMIVSIDAFAQGVRQPSNPETQTQSKTDATTTQTLLAIKPAPSTFEAQYQGGIFGYSEKIKGTLTFDDVNKRLVFRNKENKEIFALPYKSLLVVSSSSKSQRPTEATVASAIPVPGAGLFGLVRTKKRYLITEFNDTDSEVHGVASFKVANKEMLQSVIYSLGAKAELKQRGDAFYRPREEKKPVI